MELHFLNVPKLFVATEQVQFLNDPYVLQNYDTHSSHLYEAIVDSSAFDDAWPFSDVESDDFGWTQVDVADSRTFSSIIFTASPFSAYKPIIY